MADQYGVVPTGFARKTLGDNLAELERAMVDLFGADIVLDAQSPVGQLIGLFADIVTDLWEVDEDIYQSFDVDQASGTRLDTLAKLRRLQRPDGEADADFQYRLTNQGQADISLTTNLSRVRAIEGVTWANVRANSENVADSYGLPAHSVAYAVTGGDDQDVGLAVYQLNVAGITLYGNTDVPVVADGYCQTVRFIRPEEVPIRVEVDVRQIPDGSGCAPPSAGSIVQAIIAAFAGNDGLLNGETVTSDRIALAASRAGDLKIIEVRIARADNMILLEEIPMTLFERAVITAPYVAVEYV